MHHFTIISEMSNNTKRYSFRDEGEKFTLRGQKLTVEGDNQKSAHF